MSHNFPPLNFPAIKGLSLKVTWHYFYTNMHTRTKMYANKIGFIFHLITRIN